MPHCSKSFDFVKFYNFFQRKTWYLFLNTIAKKNPCNRNGYRGFSYCRNALRLFFCASNIPTGNTKIPSETQKLHTKHTTQSNPNQECNLCRSILFHRQRSLDTLFRNSEVCIISLNPNKTTVSVQTSHTCAAAAHTIVQNNVTGIRICPNEILQQLDRLLRWMQPLPAVNRIITKLKQITRISLVCLDTTIYLFS